MVAKPATPPVDESGPDDEAIEELVAAFIARNRDALNESIRRSREEVAQGNVSTRTIAQIGADARKRFLKGQ